MITIYIEFEAKPGCMERLVARLRKESHVCIEQDDGCMRMELGIPAGSSDRVVLSELWRDRASVEVHKQRPTHSHAWEQELVATKRVVIYDVIESPVKPVEQ